MPWGTFVLARSHPEGYRTADLAEAFGVCAETIRRWHKQGRLPGTKVGHRTIIFPRAAIHAMLRNGKNISL